MKMPRQCLIPILLIFLLTGCTSNPKTSQTAPSPASNSTLPNPSPTINIPKATNDDPILGSTLGKWVLKYGNHQGKNQYRFQQNYITVGFFNSLECYRIFLQFAYLDQKRRTSTEADAVAKEFLPQDASVVETGKKAQVEEERFYYERDIYDSSDLKKVFGNGFIEVKKTVWSDSDPKPGVSDIQISYITEQEAAQNAKYEKHLEELSKQDTVQTDKSKVNQNPEKEKVLELINSLQNKNIEQLKQHRDFLELQYQSLNEQYQVQRKNPNQAAWNDFASTTSDAIEKQKEEFIYIFVDTRSIPIPHVKFTLSIAELFAKLNHDLINEMSNELNGKKNDLPQVKNDIEVLFKSLKNDGLL